MTPGKQCVSEEHRHREACGKSRAKVDIPSLTDATLSGSMAQFAVRRTHRQLVEDKRPWIEGQFRVGVQLSSYAEVDAVGPGPASDQPDSSSSCLRPDQLAPVIADDASEQVWVEIYGDVSGAAKAKEYILSLCQGSNNLRIQEKLPPGFGYYLADKLDRIAVQTHTVIERIGQTDILSLSGDETNLAIARSLIDEECNALRRRQEFSPALNGEECPFEKQTFESSPSPRRSSPKERGFTVEETSLSAFHTPSNTSPSRTITPNVRAPTCADAYGEPDTPEMGRTLEDSHRHSPRLIAHSVSITQPDVKDSKAVSVTNSMQKLGYSKEQVELILRQLGPNADHNDVLGALVNQRPSKTDLEDVRDAGKEETRKAGDMSDGFPSADVAEDESSNLRPIIIDGSNVAMSFGNKDVFACKGIEIVVKWFSDRGHDKIIVFVPAWRKEASKPDTPITDQGILTDLEKQGFLVWTPSRRINGRRIVCYDDRYIVKTASEEDGIIVSNDNFRDIQNERPEWRKVIDERLLMYSFVNDRFMPPDDPLGRHGPSLDNFLRMKPTMPDHLPQACPYGKKCTYGNKCKYYHADRPNRPMKSISETLKERDKNRKERAKLNSDRSSSPRFSSVSSAPIPGYAPPDDVATTPEWHTTPLPGPSNHQTSPRRGGRIASESSALQANPMQPGSPRHFYTSESASSSPRDEVFRTQDMQPYPHSTGMPQSHGQATPPSRNTPPLGRASHTVPLPSFSQYPERPNQRDMFTVPLQQYPSQNHQERGYALMEESLNQKRMSLPPVMYGSAEAVNPASPGINFDRRASHNDLVSDFQRMGIRDPSGMPSLREPPHNFSYRPSPSPYHSGEQFPGQPAHSSNHFGESSQGTSQPVMYHSGDSFVPRHPVQSGLNLDQRMYPSPTHTPPPSYHQRNEALPGPYYSPGQLPPAGEWPSNARRLPDPAPSHRPMDPVKSFEEQRKHIMVHLSRQFGQEKVEAVMQRHPHETNPKMLMMYMSTNT